MTAKIIGDRGPGLRLVLEAMMRKDPSRRHLLRLLDELEARGMGGRPELLGVAEQAALADLWAWAQASLGHSKAGKAKRRPTLDREDEVLDAHRRLRRHVSQRDDAKRIADQLDMPSETVRSILKRSRKSLT